MRVSSLRELVAQPALRERVGVVELDPEDTVDQIMRFLRQESEAGERRVVLVFPPKEGEIPYLPIVFDQLNRFKRQTGMNILIVASSGSPAERFAQPGRFVVLPTLEECAEMLGSLQANSEADLPDMSLPPLAAALDTAPAAGALDEEGAFPAPIDSNDDADAWTEQEVASRDEQGAPREDEVPAAVDTDGQETTHIDNEQAEAYGEGSAQTLDGRVTAAEIAPSNDTGDGVEQQTTSPGGVDSGERSALYEADERSSTSYAPAAYAVADSDAGPPDGVESTAPPRRRWGVARAVVVLVLILVLAAGVAMAVYGGPQGAMAQVLQSIGQDRATVIFAPVAHPVQVDSIVTASPAASFDPARRLLPLRLLSATSGTQSASAPTTGTKTIPATPATGTLILSNYDFNQAVNVPNGTSFKASNGLSYVTTASVTVAAAQIGPNGPIPGQASVNAQATQAGAAGNIGAGSINTTYGSSVFVHNAEAFTGGQDTQHLRVVQQSDINGLEQRLVSRLQSQVQQALTNQMSGADVLIGAFAYVPQVKSSAQAGDVADTVTVTVSVSGSGLTYDRNQYQQLVQALLVQKASALGPNYQLMPRQWRYGAPQAVSQGKNHTVYFQVTASGWGVYHFSRGVLTRLAHTLAGRPRNDAQTYLERHVPDVDPASVVIELPWGITALPGAAGDIAIQVRDPTLPTHAP